MESEKKQAPAPPPKAHRGTLSRQNLPYVPTSDTKTEETNGVNNDYF